MNVEISLDVKSLEKSLKRTQEEIVSQIPKALMQTAQFGTQIILDRTEKGVGINGKFVKYTPKYAKFKSLKGHPTTVNLMFTGKMLASIQQRMVNKNAAQIYFGRATEAKKAAFNNERRPFFGFNNNEQQRLSKFFVGRFK